MKNTRFIQLFVVLFSLGPLLSVGMSACASCPKGSMNMADQNTTAVQMPSCHTTVAQASGPVQFASACCCAELACADQERPVSTGPVVEGPTVPMLELVLYTVIKEFRVPVALASGWVHTETPRTSAVPLYQLKRSLLI